ncbi:MAG: DUF2232 domain-containing protein [Candidatus Eisenbacteria bacterium]
MTSIVERSRSGRLVAGLRVLALLLTLAVPALLTAGPWAVLWLAVPGIVAGTLLAAWRFGLWGGLAPAAVLAGVAAVAAPGSWWPWWVPATALSGAWMGWREERSTFAGGRAWMLFPVLALAAVLTLLPGYAARIDHLDGSMRTQDPQVAKGLIDMAADPSSSWMVKAWLQVPEVTEPVIRQWVGSWAEARKLILPNMVPTVLFVWMALLVAAGRALAGRFADFLGWPPLSRMRFGEWRLPDGAIWTFLAGLALLLAPLPGLTPAGWTLLLNSGLGFCFQGIAIVESLLLARGIPLPVVILTLTFVFLIAWPLFLMTAAVLGLSDVWLDYRRLEASPDGDVKS